MANRRAMKILHIACIENSLFNGVSVAAPLHANYQAEFCDAAFFNVSKKAIDSAKHQILIGSEFDLDAIVNQFGLPTLAVFHEVYRFPYLRIASALKKARIPYIIVPHGELSEKSQRKKALKKKTANALLFNRFIDGALAIQCLSGGELSETHFGRRKFIGTNGICLPEYYPFRAEDGIKILYIGRLEVETKGIDLMLDAIDSQRDLMKERSAVLSIYGPDYCGRAAQVEELINSRQLQGLVKLGPAVVGQEKEALLRGADFFMQTSRTEGMPLGVLEAMAYGLPCLITQGTRLGGFVQSHQGGWVAETNVASIGESLAAALLENSSERVDKGIRARSAVESEFEWHRVACRALGQYRELLQLSEPSVVFRGQS